MHEMSIAVEICRMAEVHLASATSRAPARAPGRGEEPPSAPRLVALGLEVGADSGVELESLRFCLEALLAAPPFNGARAVIAAAGGDVLRLTYLEVDDGGADD